jgi:5'-nucleotidase
MLSFVQRNVKSFFSFFAVLVFTALVSLPAAAQDFKLTILHNNDGESNLIDAGDGALADFGGIARFKTLADSLKSRAADSGRSVIMLSSGDNFLAGPEFFISQELPADEAYYDSRALDLVGYDAMAIGNHEFDFGPEVLARFIRGFSSSQAPFISANLDFSAEDSLQALVDQGRIAPRIILNVDGEQVGIIGATTPMLRSISSPRNVVIDPDVAGIIQAHVDTLESMGVNKIILISHLQSILEDSILATQLRGIDVMIAGGGDEVLANPGALLAPGDTSVVAGNYPVIVNNIDSQPVYVITTGGDYRYIGKLEVDFDTAGVITNVLASSGPVRVAGGSYPDSVSQNSDIYTNIVQPLIAELEGLQSNIIGVSEVVLNGVRNDVRGKETNLGNLVADAFLWQGTQLASAFGVPEPDIALQNGGGIRNNSMIQAGNISELTTFDVLPFANFVAVVPSVPASQLKEILENAVSRIEFGDGRFAQISGFRFIYNPNGTAQIVDDFGTILTPGNRVWEVMLDDGTYLVQNGAVLPGAPAVNIATIDFLARNGDQYPFRNNAFTTLGVTYQQALANYITGGLAGTINSADYPLEGENRIISDATVPVELTGFSSIIDGNNVSLNWSTATETNNKGFEIYRDRALIAFVEGSGTSTEKRNYSYVDKNVAEGSYIYKLVQVDFDGTITESGAVNVTISSLPTEYSLEQNYPNPFNPSTTIKFSLPEEGNVKLKLYNALGEEVKLLLDAFKEAGRYEMKFDLSGLSSGFYIYKLEAGNYTGIKKMVMIK